MGSMSPLYLPITREKVVRSCFDRAKIVDESFRLVKMQGIHGEGSCRGFASQTHACRRIVFLLSPVHVSSIGVGFHESVDAHDKAAPSPRGTVRRPRPAALARPLLRPLGSNLLQSLGLAQSSFAPS